MFVVDPLFIHCSLHLAGTSVSSARRPSWYRERCLDDPQAAHIYTPPPVIRNVYHRPRRNLLDATVLLLSSSVEFGDIARALFQLESDHPPGTLASILLLLLRPLVLLDTPPPSHRIAPLHSPPSDGPTHPAPPPRPAPPLSRRPVEVSFECHSTPPSPLMIPPRRVPPPCLPSHIHTTITLFTSRQPSPHSFDAPAPRLQLATRNSPRRSRLVDRC